MAFEEAVDNVRAKGEGDAALVFGPAGDVLVGVGPQEVAEEAGVGDVGGAHDAADLVHVVQVGGEPAVHAKNLFVHNRRYRQAIEAVRERLPQLYIVPSFTYNCILISTKDPWWVHSS